MISEHAQAFMERLYSAAEHAGFLVECTWYNEYGFKRYSMVSFRTSDHSLLRGLVSSAEPTITFPVGAIPELARGDSIEIHDKPYSVREITIIGEGTEIRATLASMKDQDQ